MKCFVCILTEHCTPPQRRETSKCMLDSQLQKIQEVYGRRLQMSTQMKATDRFSGAEDLHSHVTW